MTYTEALNLARDPYDASLETLQQALGIIEAQPTTERAARWGYHHTLRTWIGHIIDP